MMRIAAVSSSGVASRPSSWSICQLQSRCHGVESAHWLQVTRHADRPGEERRTRRRIVQAAFACGRIERIRSPASERPRLVDRAALVDQKRAREIR